MSVAKLLYSSPQTITLASGLTSLTSGGWYRTDVIDNSTDAYIDALVGGLIQIGNVTVDGSLDFFAYGSWDGTNYTAGLDGSGGAITWGSSPADTGVDSFADLPWLGVAMVDNTDDGSDVRFGPFSIARAFGGIMPVKWGIVVRNNTGLALHATGTNNAMKFTGVTISNV